MNNSALYLLISSYSNLIVIIYPLLTRIIFDGYEYQVEENLVFILCKFRYYILHTFDQMSLICICLTIFDRYIISSQQVRLRRLTTKRRTKQILLLILCLCGFDNIPISIYYDKSSYNQCIISSISYSYYYFIVFQILLHGIVPICFLTIFSLLTYKQLKMIHRQRIVNYDKQFSHMLLLLSLAIIISSIPYSIEHFYYMILSNHSNKISSILFLFHVITSLLFYTNSVFSFYIYFISTPNFRRQLYKLIQCNRQHHNFIHQINVIQPTLTLS